MEQKPLNLLLRLKGSPYVFPLAALAALALLFISETAYWQSTRSMRELATLSTARTQLMNLSRRIVDAETGQRGYLLTARTEYLAPYRAAFGDIDKALLWLRDYYDSSSPNGEAMKRLDTLVKNKLSELEATMRLYNEGRSDLWRDMLLTDIGKEQMEEIRRVSEQLMAAEAREDAAARDDVYDTLLLNRIGVAAMSAISLLALAMYLRQTAALDAHRRERQQAIEAERDQLEIEVARRTAQLTDLTQELTKLAQHLQTAREDERSRLARELHDELGALLTAAKLDAARIRSRLGTGSPEASERLAHLSELLNNGIALKRRIIEDLRPSSLSNLGLLAALEIQAREFGERSGTEVRCELEAVKLRPAAELTVYRLVQEAFTNIAKYAQAKRVDVTLAARDGAAEISVRDDGVGFDATQRRSSSHGLLGMRYRVEAEGGSFTLDSAPGQGTRIRAVLPMSSE
ncbi:CHASE3 domain-containing protein [Piscinibacter sp.]|uniref:CHASE3 domain-containing protein n=1 Tax=Piscinibacter sp. TaxID=1903157 RepID=UPI002C332FD6|nr:CHASE3 domain-containing protein [Albitalea sp.]HUG26234.1 CHASE3 domain-containing protein [Albitalea sp.]